MAVFGDRWARPPEERLLLAVFEQALADLDDPCPAVRADAEAYFFLHGPDAGAFGFHAVCAHFGLSPTAVRAALRRKLERRSAEVRAAA
ncbi:MAG: hypothetical protein KatS3mg076_1438 [Candidatus Binatia bacterium]|nr:MAG: hypothetical protein KatS3mg076_1438 [Candidatus Binatia bacterium]